ncbi:MAG: hypothetical protein NVSMB9_30400 [Isosphaeraceae bacterium]
MQSRNLLSNAPRTRFIPHLLGLLALLVVPACDPSRNPTHSTSTTRTNSLQKKTLSHTDYKLVGVVRTVDPATGQVTIRHESIPGFMEAMTMPFLLKNHEDLEDVHPCGEVEGTLRVDREG